MTEHGLWSGLGLLVERIWKAFPFARCQDSSVANPGQPNPLGGDAWWLSHRVGLLFQLSCLDSIRLSESMLLYHIFSLYSRMNCSENYPLVPEVSWSSWTPPFHPPPGSFHCLPPSPCPTHPEVSVFLLSHITGSFRTQLLQWFFISWGFLTVHFYSFPVTRDCFPLLAGSCRRAKEPVIFSEWK